MSDDCQPHKVSVADEVMSNANQAEEGFGEATTSEVTRPCFNHTSLESPTHPTRLTYTVLNPVLMPRPDCSNSITTSANQSALSLNESMENLAKSMETTKAFLEQISKPRINSGLVQTLEERLNSLTMGNVSEKSEESDRPPIKRACIGQTMESMRTATQRTPQRSRKFQHLDNIPENERMFTTPPTRETLKAVRSMPDFTPQHLVSSQHKDTPSSILKVFLDSAIQNSIQTQMIVDVDPLHGPVMLKSIGHIKWSQKMNIDPEWLNKQMPEWDLLPDNYLDKHGPTAGKEKTGLQREADRIVVEVINKHRGDMDKVRIEIFEMGKQHMKAARRDRILKLMEKYKKKIEHYNSTVARYNQLVKKLDEKKHADVEEFIAGIKLRVQGVIDELNSD